MCVVCEKVCQIDTSSQLIKIQQYLRSMNSIIISMQI